MFYGAGLILCLGAVLVSAEYCPNRDYVYPCRCERDRSGRTFLTCDKVYDTQVLLRVFENSRRFGFEEFILEDSSLQYIPHQIFDDVVVRKLNMTNVTLRNLFDEVPRDPGITAICATGVKILGGFDWKMLADFKELEKLYLPEMRLRKLTTDFHSNVNKKLRLLSLPSCKLKRLQDDEFAEFTELKWIVLADNAIVDIKRTMFPRSNKLLQIDFDYNRISTLPDDLFSDMPFLRWVDLRGNMLAVLSEDTFRPVISQLYNLAVEENPIKCDCLIAWVLEERFFKIGGNCYAPITLRDKRIEELTRRDIRCEMSSNSIF